MYLNFIVLDLSLSHLVILLSHNNKAVYKNKIALKRDRAGILFNSIQSMISELNLNLSDLDILFSTIGPGNFNGIRVSLSFVKGFAITHNTQIAGLSSLEAISRSFLNNNKKNIFSIIKASPNFYYIEFFDQFNKSIVPSRLINIDEEITLPVSIDDIVLVGNDVEILAKNINFHGEMHSIDSPTAESLFYTAKGSIVNSNFIEPNPIYLREVNAQKPSNWKNNPIVK